MGVSEDLETWQKEYLSPYCLKKCVKTCCSRRDTKVLMRELHVRKVYGLSLTDIIDNENAHFFAGWRSDRTRMYWVSIHPTAKQPYCPAYDADTRHCTLKDKKPLMCKEYPLFLEGKTLKISRSCNALQNYKPVANRLIKISQNYSLVVKKVWHF